VLQPNFKPLTSYHYKMVVLCYNWSGVCTVGKWVNKPACMVTIWSMHLPDGFRSVDCMYGCAGVCMV